MTPTLNWREIARLTTELRPLLLDHFVDRIIVPERPRFPSGYLKGEWAMRLTSRRSDRIFLFSIRARHPYMAVIEGKGPKAAQTATRSPFDMAAGKFLKGARIRSFDALPQERVIVMGFEAEGERIGLVLGLIPALPEALLVKLPQNWSEGTSAQNAVELAAGAGTKGWPILARSRTLRDEKAVAVYFPPDGKKAPLDLPLRAELFEGKGGILKQLEQGLDHEAFELRLRAAEREVRALIKQATDRARQSEVSIKEAKAEPDWQRYGDLLKASLTDPPPIQKEKGPKGEVHVRSLFDFEQEKYFQVPCDPKLDASAQAEKFYSMSRRKARRLQEAGGRAKTFREAAARLEKLIESLPAPLDWPGLEKLEKAAGRPLQAPVPHATGREKRSGAWLGKSFTSKDGLSILVGRSRDENLELTFKHARGNDVWLHVRGKPGAHVVVPVHSGKSVPLDTLLDAAHLVLHYSGGGKWGKTEVDYTFKKYVKRIKDSTEASYTNNKTLLIEPDPVRLKRLLSEDA